MYQKQEKKLKELRKDLNNRIKDIKISLSKIRSKDWSEAAIEAENDEVLEAIYSESSQELLQVKQALRRIKNGEYGECTQCAAEINKKRLKIMPYTTLCIGCAQKLEYQNN